MPDVGEPFATPPIRLVLPSAAEIPPAPPMAAGCALRRLLIMACGATKRHDDGLLPALDRYHGPPYRTLRATLRELADDQRPSIAILSAAFGLIAATTPIPDYDQRMTPPHARALRDPVRVALDTILNADDYAATFVNLGADYWSALPFDPPTRARLGLITIAQGGIGQRMAQLQRWLRHPAPLSSPHGHAPPV